MTVFGFLCAYMLIGLLALHQRPQLIERGSVADTSMSVLKLSLKWPLWIRREA